MRIDKTVRMNVVLTVRPQSSPTQLSSILACFMISEPEIRKSFEWPRDKLGYIKLIYVVPTLCYLLHIDPPRQSRGSVFYELMK